MLNDLDKYVYVCVCEYDDVEEEQQSAIPAEHFAMGDSKGGDRGSPPFGASKSVAFAQHKNKEAFPRSLAGMAEQQCAKTKSQPYAKHHAMVA